MCEPANGESNWRSRTEAEILTQPKPVISGITLEKPEPDPFYDNHGNGD